MLLVRKNYQPTVSNLINEFFANDWFERMDNISNLGLPKSNISETEKSFKIEMSVPGYSKEDFNLHVEDNLLVVSVEKEETKEEEKDNFVYHEFNVNNFKRSFRLSKNVDSNSIEANYENGILKIEIPKKEESVLKKLIAVK